MDHRQADVGENHTPDWNAIARDVSFRPWPVPARPWVLAQSWRDLLFAHWPLSPATLRPLIPQSLALDTFAGDAWIGVIPFRISHIAPRGVPHRLALAFPELNVRTYVTADGQPGVWFFSLDAASMLAVIGARLGVNLPYYWAEMSLRDDANGIAYASNRRFWPTAAFRARYRPTGPVFWSAPGTLEDWLTARYCLYAPNRRRGVHRVEIHHPPWPLQPAEADIPLNTMTRPIGLEFPGAPLLHYARALDVVTWLPERVESRAIASSLFSVRP
jgi:uncharacterized protein YqjF (DUF2071 family)